MSLWEFVIFLMSWDEILQGLLRTWRAFKRWLTLSGSQPVYGDPRSFALVLRSQMTESFVPLEKHHNKLILIGLILLCHDIILVSGSMLQGNVEKAQCPWCVLHIIHFEMSTVG